LGGIGAAHHFHTRNVNPDDTRHVIDDPFTTYISWPNFHSGANGDYQEITIAGPEHPVLRGVRYLPAHPHEGDVDAPLGDASARVIAWGKSKVTGQPFNLAVAFEASDAGGRAIAQSTFHHFADYNWDPASGCPSFVTEPPGHGIADMPAAQQSIRAYARNVALWLVGRPV